MLTVNFLKFKQNLNAFLDKANHFPIIVTQANGNVVMIMSKSEYDSWEETLYLLKSPRNAERLLRSIEGFE
ncbi:type II toxin-antitoxin system prevent-host-death family antitoxin [Lacihabitans sp. LS3-19]|uniref:type II toxin-antitoxin system Phd/YefM family antitoxin n=1 Tax=Lacihabitans sp. LS3-19 TaxID=2487335 RepID=UPI0020CDD7B6|nr:type II toxin-antitoxin system prevent-host-death family antitoxin [Lacihabitans sp. LS3-19]MCP9769174.1 type II toxin-antitoxin system prevent-host-death family antitoxin [Lacihabitans sp. LS3-19]